MKKKNFLVVGCGMPTFLEKIAEKDIVTSIILNEPVKLKDCHETPEHKKLEVQQKLKTVISEEMIVEYILIKRKESKLSRAKRDYITDQVEIYIRKGLLSEEELNLLIDKD